MHCLFSDLICPFQDGGNLDDIITDRSYAFECASQ